jgi:hypothetical protein
LPIGISAPFFTGSAESRLTCDDELATFSSAGQENARAGISFVIEPG